MLQHMQPGRLGIVQKLEAACRALQDAPVVELVIGLDHLTSAMQSLLGIFRHPFLFCCAPAYLFWLAVPLPFV